MAALLLLAPGAIAMAAEIDRAREHFWDADFEMALAELGGVLASTGLDAGARHEALALKAQCHARLGDDAAAIDAFCGALVLDPGWTPDPTLYSFDEMGLFRRAYAQCPQVVTPEPTAAEPMATVTDAAPEPGTAWYKKKGTWIAAGALLTLAALAGSSGDDAPAASDDRVPDFPEPPRAPGVAWSW